MGPQSHARTRAPVSQGRTWKPAPLTSPPIAGPHLEAKPRRPHARGVDARDIHSAAAPARSHGRRRAVAVRGGSSVVVLGRPAGAVPRVDDYGSGERPRLRRHRVACEEEHALELLSGSTAEVDQRPRHALRPGLKAGLRRCRCWPAAARGAQGRQQGCEQPRRLRLHRAEGPMGTP